MEERREGREQRGIQSIEVGFRLLKVLSRAGDKLPLKHLAAQADMPPSKAHLYLVSFARTGLVVQDPVTGHYGLGPEAIHIGVGAINQLHVVDVARGPMEELREQFGIAFSLSIWGNRGPTIIFRLDNLNSSPLAVKVGFVMPLLTSATGLMFFAHLPDAETRNIAAIEAAQAPGALASARAAVPAIRKEGLSQTENKFQSGYYGVSAPVFDSDGRIRATITAIGLAAFNEAAVQEQLSNRLREAARQCSDQLGYRSEPDSDC